MSKPHHIAIVGGGIAGLTTAYRLLASSPTVHVTLLEGSRRVGGWVRSKRIGKEEALCEAGPRTLRPAGPAGLATLQLVHELGLGDQLLAVPTSAPAARNRYVYADGSLHTMRPWSMLTDNYLRPLLRGMVLEAFGRRNTPTNTTDESINAFMSRRLSPLVADRAISALVAGIYAGDTHQLSMRACFNKFWRADQEYGSFARGMIYSARHKDSEAVAYEQQKQAFCAQPHLSPGTLRALDASIYSFRDGMQTLTDTLARTLQRRWPTRYTLRTDTPLQRVTTTESAVELHLPGGEIISADHVVAAVPASVLAAALDTAAPSPLQQLGEQAANVAVVNLVYHRALDLPSGFGYLVPSIVPDTLALGVVFDSQALSDQDDPRRGPLTRLTVMLGGATRWQSTHDTAPDDYFLQQAMRTVRDHLGVQTTPDASWVNVQRRCIPQYQVGHVERLRDLHRALSAGQLSRISVTGASYTGVSVNDCVYHAGRLAHQLLSDTAVPVTGLEAAWQM